MRPLSGSGRRFAWREHRGPEATVRPRASRVPVACDGEVVRMQSPLVYRIRPQALTILAPPTEAG